MNTSLKTYLIVALLLLVGGALSAQNERMTRDIEVAENILSTLIEQEFNSPIGSNVEGTYIEGQGVLFTIGSNGLGRLSWGTGFTYAYTFPPDVAIASQNGRAPRAKAAPTSDQNETNLDSLNTAIHDHVKNVMKTFMTDYAHLLGQLSPNEKILIRYSPSNRFGRIAIAGAGVSLFSGSDDGDNTPTELTAEVSKSSIDDFHSGKLSKEQFAARIKYAEKTIADKKDAELELLSSIFNRLYQGDLSKTFQLVGSPSYEKIEGLGAIFEMNFGNLRGWQNRRQNAFYIDASGQFKTYNNKSEDEKDDETDVAEKMKENYPQFLEEFKQNVIEYGRTVHNLPSDEMLMFKLHLNRCEDCDIPGKIEVSVKKSVLEDYDKNKISLDQAVSQITVKTNDKED